MNINELFELLQDNISDKINGEITLYKNTIIWSYTLEDIDEESNFNDDDDNDFFFGFESTSSEEKLVEIYQNDFDVIEMTLLDYDEEDNWSFSDYKIKQNSISFKIS